MEATTPICAHAKVRALRFPPSAFHFLHIVPAACPPKRGRALSVRMARIADYVYDLAVHRSFSLNQSSIWDVSPTFNLFKLLRTCALLPINE